MSPAPTLIEMHQVLEVRLRPAQHSGSRGVMGQRGAASVFLWSTLQNGPCSWWKSMEHTSRRRLATSSAIAAGPLTPPSLCAAPLKGIPKQAPFRSPTTPSVFSPAGNRTPIPPSRTPLRKERGVKVGTPLCLWPRKAGLGAPRPVVKVGLVSVLAAARHF